MNIKPYHGVGAIEFGVPIEKVRTLFNNLEAWSDSDRFGEILYLDEIGLRCFFRENKCLSISCFSPAIPTLSGIRLFDLNQLDIIKQFGQDKKIIDDDDYSIFDSKLGILFYFENAPSDVSTTLTAYSYNYARTLFPSYLFDQ